MQDVIKEFVDIRTELDHLITLVEPGLRAYELDKFADLEVKLDKAIDKLKQHAW